MPERYLGQTLGKFRVDSLVGSGGFAWVYKAWDPELEIPVALKVLKPQYAGDEKFESRFRREASTAARLRHPNIVKIFAVGKEGTAVYFAMDYLPQNLTDRLEVMTALPEPMLLRMGIDVASALGFAHREGVVHRDIKVDNILFDDHGNAVVADFGIARAVSNYVDQTGTNMVVGTPQYFSPEQARGQPLDGRADIYSLGVTLFRAATGELPFTGDDWYEIARQHVEDKPPKPRALNPTLSREVEQIILRCLEKEPDDRFPNGEQLCQALADVAHEGGRAGRTLIVPPIDTRPGTVVLPRTGANATWLERRLPWLERPAARFGAAAAAVLLFLALPAVFLLRGPGTAASTSATPAAAATRTGPTDGKSLPATTRETIATTMALPAAPVRPSLRVVGPKGALLKVDGQAVGTRSWHTDTLPAGSYVVSAELPSAGACPSALQERTVVLDSGVKSVRLEPRACGWLKLTTQPPVATYTLKPVEGSGKSLQGPVAHPDSIMLGAGSYALSLAAPFCAQYSDTIEVRPGAVLSRRVRLICGGK